MAAARSTLPLPPELLMRIFEYCEDYDWSEDPYAVYGPFAGHSDSESVTWIRATSAARRKICDVRLVCKSFAEASITSFATLLGHRRFRITTTGLDDLRAMGKVEALVPWIKTLTFGAADVDKGIDGAHSDLYQSSIYFDSWEKECRQLQALALAAKDYKPVSRASASERLITALEAFPGLEELRIGPYDRADYLGGWLTSNQRRDISSELQPDTYLSSVCEESFDWFNEETATELLYRPSHSQATHLVLEALQKTSNIIRSLKFSNHPCKPLESAFLPETLHTLRIPVGHDFFAGEGADVNRSTTTPFLTALSTMQNLQDFSLLLVDKTYADWTASPYHTESVFRAIQKASSLRRFDLQGEWYTFTTEFINFSKGHASSLRRLVLHETILFGDQWLSVLHDLEGLTRDRLEYLKVTSAYFQDKNEIVMVDCFDTYTRSEWPSFTCTTHFGPNFCLLPDTGEYFVWPTDPAARAEVLKD